MNLLKTLFKSLVVLVLAYCTGYAVAIDLTDCEGYITSPNYPSGYPINQNIVWNIQGSGATKIYLGFLDFATERTSDYLDVKDGNSASSPLLMKLTGSYEENNLPLLNSSGNALYLNFRSNNGVSYRGFNVYYWCSLRTYTLNDGSIASYLFQYSNVVVTYVVQFPDMADSEGYLKFQNFSLLPGDQLEIRNGSEATSPVIAILTGDQLPPLYFLSEGFRLRFVSFSDEPSPGFNASFSTTKRRITRDGEFCSSPFYPQDYPGDIFLDLAFIVDFSEYGQNSLVAFTFLDLDTEDAVIIYDGDAETDPWIGSYTNQSQLSVISTVTKMRITLKSTGVVYRGFRGQVHRIVANQVIAEQNATFTSPLFPEKYPEGLYMIWIVDMSEFGQSSTTNLEFVSFDTFPTHIVEVRDGDSHSDRLLGLYSGSTKPELVVSSGSKLRIRFTAGRFPELPGLGFLARVCEVNPVVINNITFDGATIVSPSYPGNYPSNLDVTWVIDLSEYGPTTAVHLRSETFSTTDNMDVLTVREGRAADGALIGSFYGMDKIQATSAGPILNARFTTNCLNERSGFSLIVERVSTGPEYITQDETVFSSPGYPDNYPTEFDKVWIVDFTHYGQNVLVHIQFLDFETLVDEDVVEVRNGESESGILLGRFSGSNLPPRLTSADTKMRIAFKATSAVSEGKGFQARVTKIETDSKNFEYAYHK